jgi:porphobilinogen synthase
VIADLDIRTSTGGFTRTRRTRRTAALRGLVRETRLDPSSFVYPIFVTHGRGAREPISSMPDQYRLSIDQLPGEARELRSLGIRAVLLFGLPASKDPVGSEGYAPDGIVQQAVRALKDADPELAVICDVCLCEYTDHGHCGVLSTTGEVLNDESLPLLAQMAVSCAEAGADVVAPSDMMDGRIGMIRHQLDEEGHPDTAIIAYSAKYASAFYGPFRDAVESTLEGDRRTYQLDPGNRREGLREAMIDIDEGADIVMVKPAGSYLDVLADVAAASEVPVWAYQVSGEYAMIEAAAAHGWIDRKRAVIESVRGIRRAGADAVLTYWAVELAEWIRNGDVA